MANLIIRTLGLATCFVGISVAQAAVITPVSVTASSRFFNNAQDDPVNLLGAGFTQNNPIETSTHENSNWNALPNAGWFASTAVQTLDFNLGGTFTVGKAHIWNWNGATDVVNWGVDNFTLRFSQDAVFGNGDDTTQSFSLSAASGLNTYTGEHFTLTPVVGVTNIRLSTDTVFAGNNGILGLSEVRFSSAPAVPEPSTVALAALGLLSLGFIGWRRRRR